MLHSRQPNNKLPKTLREKIQQNAPNFPTEKREQSSSQKTNLSYSPYIWQNINTLNMHRHLQNERKKNIPIEEVGQDFDKVLHRQNCRQEGVMCVSLFSFSSLPMTFWYHRYTVYVYLDVSVLYINRTIYPPNQKPIFNPLGAISLMLRMHKVVVTFKGKWMWPEWGSTHIFLSWCNHMCGFIWWTS